MTEEVVRTSAVARDAWFRSYVWIIAIGLVGYTWNIKPDLSPNDRSRWDTVWSLVEYNTYEIFDTEDFGDKQQFPTIDKVVRRHDGKTISSKPPLLPTVIAQFVRGVKLVIGEPFSKDLRIPERPTEPGSIHLYGKLVLWVFQVAPFIACLVLFRRFLDRYAASTDAWRLSLLTMGVGTFVTGYLVTLNNHVIGATAAFIGLYHLIRIWYENDRPWWRYVVAGTAVGWAAANEIPAALYAIVAVVVAVASDVRKGLFGFLPPLVLLGAAFLYTNYLAVGDPENPWQMSNFLPAYLQKDLYQTDASGEPSYWARTDKSGIDALNDHPEPYWLYVTHCMVGHHGLFSLSPIFLVTLLGLGTQMFGRNRPLAGLGPPVLLVSAVVFAFYLFVTDQRNYGGFCHGLRWVQWMGLCWLFFLPFGIEAVRGRPWMMRLVWIAFGISALSMFDTLANPWTRSWLHWIFWRAEIIDY